MRDASSQVEWSRVKLAPSTSEESSGSSLDSSQEALRIGGVTQKPLEDTKDTPNWGDIYLATAAATPNVQVATSLQWV